MRLLGLVHGPRLRSEQRVSVGFGATSSEFLVRMEIRGFEPIARFELGPPGSGPHWGLWESDVVEVFVADLGSNSARLPYYEFQISPLGQYFELEIRTPRVAVNRDYRSGGRWMATRLGDSGDGWDALFRIPWTAIGVKHSQVPTEVLGNVFAILGQGKDKRHLSLFTPAQDQPDFHLPEHFQRISFASDLS